MLYAFPCSLINAAQRVIKVALHGFDALGGKARLVPQGVPPYSRSVVPRVLSRAQYGEFARDLAGDRKYIARRAGPARGHSRGQLGASSEARRGPMSATFHPSLGRRCRPPWSVTFVTHCAGLGNLLQVIRPGCVCTVQGGRPMVSRVEGTPTADIGTDRSFNLVPTAHQLG